VKFIPSETLFTLLDECIFDDYKSMIVLETLLKENINFRFSFSPKAKTKILQSNKLLQLAPNLLPFLSICSIDFPLFFQCQSRFQIGTDFFSNFAKHYPDLSDDLFDYLFDLLNTNFTESILFLFSVYASFFKIPSSKIPAFYYKIALSCFDSNPSIRGISQSILLILSESKDDSQFKSFSCCQITYILDVFPDFFSSVFTHVDLSIGKQIFQFFNKNCDVITPIFYLAFHKTFGSKTFANEDLLLLLNADITNKAFLSNCLKFLLLEHPFSLVFSSFSTLQSKQLILCSIHNDELMAQLIQDMRSYFLKSSPSLDSFTILQFISDNILLNNKYIMDFLILLLIAASFGSLEKISRDILIHSFQKVFDPFGVKKIPLPDSIFDSLEKVYPPLCDLLRSLSENDFNLFLEKIPSFSKKDSTSAIRLFALIFASLLPYSSNICLLKLFLEFSSLGKDDDFRFLSSIYSNLIDLKNIQRINPDQFSSLLNFSHRSIINFYPTTYFNSTIFALKLIAVAPIESIRTNQTNIFEDFYNCFSRIDDLDIILFLRATEHFIQSKPDIIKFNHFGPFSIAWFLTLLFHDLLEVRKCAKNILNTLTETSNEETIVSGLKTKIGICDLANFGRFFVDWISNCNITSDHLFFLKFFALELKESKDSQVFNQNATNLLIRITGELEYKALEIISILFNQ
jgi:hypothetical protein